MSISKKLYVNFGAVLLAVVVLFTVIVFAVHREQSAKAAASQALEKSATTDQQRSALDTVSKNENAWVAEFAQPMLQKRREVDAGNATVADLQIYYLQKDASSWVKTSTDSLNAADHDTNHILDQRRKDDEAAGTEIIL